MSLLDLRTLDVSGSARQGGGGPTSLDITGSAPQEGGPGSAELGQLPVDEQGPTFATATNNVVVLDATQATPMQAAAPNAIPEPATLALLGLGLAGLGFSRRKR